MSLLGHAILIVSQYIQCAKLHLTSSADTPPSHPPVLAKFTMFTSRQPNNATPQRLDLSAQKVPRMPFSSPMGEEVLSPTSPNASRSPPQHQIKLSQSRGDQKPDTDNKWLLPSQRPAAGERKHSQEKVDKSRWPGLNVVTNFSKPPLLAQRAVGNETKQNPGLGLKKQQSGSRATSRKASIETLGLGHQPSGKSLKTLGSKGRLGDLQRASSKWSNLSPSDRAVVIGISVSPEELAQHSASPQTSPARNETLSEQQAIDRRSETMPTIVVTPAKEKAPWSTDEEESAKPPKPRAASSVYSQAPSHYGTRITDSSTVPPIPPLPPDAHDTQNALTETARKAPPPRIVSTFTDIDEGESPEIHSEERPGTGESRLRILTKRSSMDSIATKHRSQGWWNHIMSPFFPKSPMTLNTLATPQEPLPGIPTSLKQDRSLQEARQTFPPPPESDGLRSGHTSFTDSAIDADYEKRLALDGFRDRSTMIVDEPQENMIRDSALLPSKFEGFGAAAEYYEACLHDQHSEIPYFECENHVCLDPKGGPGGSVSPFGEASRGLTGQNIEGNEGPEQIPNLENKPDPPLAVHQAPTNRFSAAFHEAITPKSKQRPQSDTTVIDDLEATPDVQEAQAAPIVRAPLPILATQTAPVLEPEPQPKAIVEEVPISSKPNPRVAPVPPHPLSPPPGTPPRATPDQTHSSSPFGSTARQGRSTTDSPHFPRSSPRSNPAFTGSPSRQEKQPKRYIAVLPPGPRSEATFEQPLSPEPLSPAQQRRAPKDAIILDNINKDDPKPHHTLDGLGTRRDRQIDDSKQSNKAGLFLTEKGSSPHKSVKSKTSYKSSYRDSASTHTFNPTSKRYYQEIPEPEPTTIADLYPPPREVSRSQKQWQYKEKDVLPPRPQKKHEPLTFPRCRNCAKPRNKKEKNIMIAIATALTLMVILIVVLVMTLTLKKKGKNTPAQVQWLNLTNFPPLPTGIATIIQPDAVEENPDCIQPQTMWSCAVPKEEQQSIYPNAPNQPNFRVEITFQNGTNATANSTFGTTSSGNQKRSSYGHLVNAVSAGSFVRNRLLSIRSNNQFTPSPAAPNLEDQNFLGNTTDKNAEPFDGEFTPFFMSFTPASKPSSRLLKRQSSSSSNTSNNSSFPDATNAIPAPDTNPDGTAAAANLYPFPTAQPLRLYDRGLNTEHKGFYTYFDRSIFIK